LHLAHRVNISGWLRASCRARAQAILDSGLFLVVAQLGTFPEDWSTVREFRTLEFSTTSQSLSPWVQASFSLYASVPTVPPGVRELGEPSSPEAQAS
jgi:hypothetical protein